MGDRTMSTAVQQRDRLAGILGRIHTQISQVLPRHLDAETMTRVVLVEGARNPKIGRCTAESIATTVMLASQLGLQPSSPLGHFYLIPRNEKGPNGDRVMRCGYVIGYRGYLELARRAGLRMNAGVVYADGIERGSFSWTVEPPAIDHGGALGVRRTDDSLVLAYAVAVDRDGHRYQLVMDRQGIDSARGSSAGKVWRDHFAAMARKTAIRRLLAGGLVPLSTELVTALEEERRAEVVEVVEVKTPAAHPGPDPLRAALGIEDKADQAADAEA
jgi:recombination protein RecT